MRIEPRPSGVVPYKHQIEALDYASEHDHIALVMEMRLGKTNTAIWWTQDLEPIARACLVVAPLTVLDTWSRELKREGECVIPCFDLDAAERKERVALVANTRKGRRWLLMGYEGVLATPWVTEVPWDVVVCDESVALKNPAAKRTKLFCEGFRNVKHRCILTGLIRPESDLEVFMQFKFLHGRFMGHDDFYKWRVQYFRRTPDGYGWEPFPESRSVIKEMVHRKAFVRTREQVGMRKQKIYEVRKVTMTPLQRKLYEQAEDDLEIRLQSGEELETQWTIVMRNWLQHLTGGFDPEKTFVSAAKRNELVNLLKGELYGQKVVIWFRYRHEVEYIRTELRKSGIECVSVMGGEKQEIRSQKMEQFRRDPDVLCFLATEKVAQYGIDVSISSTAIYYSQEAGNNDRSQSAERILHPEKTEPLLYIDLVCRGSVDEDLLMTIRNKKWHSDWFSSEEELKRLFLERRRLRNEGKNSRKTRRGSTGVTVE